ncbi:hypothetical protein SAY87_015938 [Trapa incisa]|uniref:Uncharacterized protein n=2 Tax=Trapa TaxID=22665 RepID=A0AAN7LCY5_TRANT|nr:hypothetical protein SAY87_015938 [Trapa incisa]KAK4785548.1 hypothetical protein SAY86_002237 [Trapa natans]
MEGVSVKVYRGMKSFWVRRGYQRLDEQQAPAAGRARRRRFRLRRLKVAPRLKLLRLIVRSPKRFLVWLRDNYMKMMMELAGSRVCSTGYGYYGYVVDPAISSFCRAPIKEYDQKMLIEIYKSLKVAQGQLVPREAGELRSGTLVCRQ